MGIPPLGHSSGGFGAKLRFGRVGVAFETAIRRVNYLPKNPREFNLGFLMPAELLKVQQEVSLRLLMS